MIHRKRNSMPTVAIAIAALALAGCGGSTTGNNGDGGFDGCQGGGQKLLSVVGSPNRTMHPGEETVLAVALLEKCVGAVAGDTVNFDIQQNPGGASLSANSALTTSSGMAQVTLSVAAGELLSTKYFSVHATHPSDPEGVYFSITLKPSANQLEIIGPTNLECYVNESLELKVAVKDAFTATPARGFEVKFSIPNPPAGGNASIPTARVATNASGVATTVFQAGSLATTYSVLVEGVSGNLNQVSFTINVKNRITCTSNSDCPDGFSCVQGQCHQTGGASCRTSDDCPAGYVCQNNECMPEGSLPSTCYTSADCPQGYYCEGHECFPCPPNSNRPECQGGGDQCHNNNDCPPGFICENGICVPDNPVGVKIPELGGKWYTQHFFDTSKALGGATTSDIVNALNRAINYCDITGIGFIDDLICDFIDQYVPDWVGTLIDIFANLVNMLKELRAEGVMQVVHLNPRELISATERWDTLFVRYLNACCEGQPPGCNPYQRPNFPDCATIDITRQDLEVGDVGIEVLPFTGKIAVDNSGPITKYTLLIDPRSVRVEYSKFVGFLIDLLVEIFLGYDNLEEALMDLIDCEAIGDSAEEFCEDLGLDGWLNCSNIGDGAERTCRNLLPRADDLIKGLLNQIGVGWKMLRFSGSANITVENDDPPYGVMLGTPDFEHTKNGKWEGKVQIILDADMEGAWFGER